MDPVVATDCCVTPTSVLTRHPLPLPRFLGQESGRAYLAFCLPASPKAAVTGLLRGPHRGSREPEAGCGGPGPRPHRTQVKAPTRGCVQSPRPVPQLCPCKGALDAGTIVTSGVRSELAEPGRGCPEIGLPRWHEDRACGSSTPHPKMDGQHSETQHSHTTADRTSSALSPSPRSASAGPRPGAPGRGPDAPFPQVPWPLPLWGRASRPELRREWSCSRSAGEGCSPWRAERRLGGRKPEFSLVAADGS